MPLYFLGVVPNTASAEELRYLTTQKDFEYWYLFRTYSAGALLLRHVRQLPPGGRGGSRPLRPAVRGRLPAGGRGAVGVRRRLVQPVLLQPRLLRARAEPLRMRRLHGLHGRGAEMCV